MLLVEVVGPHLEVLELRQARREQRPHCPAAHDADPHSRSSFPPVIPDGRSTRISAISAPTTTSRLPSGKAPRSASESRESRALTESAPTTAPQRLVIPPTTSIASVRNVSSR